MFRKGGGGWDKNKNRAAKGHLSLVPCMPANALATELPDLFRKSQLVIQLEKITFLTRRCTDDLLETKLNWKL